MAHFEFFSPNRRRAADSHYEDNRPWHSVIDRLCHVNCIQLISGYVVGETGNFRRIRQRALNDFRNRKLVQEIVSALHGILYGTLSTYRRIERGRALDQSSVPQHQRRVLVHAVRAWALGCSCKDCLAQSGLSLTWPSLAHCSSYSIAGFLWARKVLIRIRIRNGLAA